MVLLRRLTMLALPVWNREQRAAVLPVSAQEGYGHASNRVHLVRDWKEQRTTTSFSISANTYANFVASRL